MSERLGRFPSGAFDATDQSQVECVVQAGPMFEAMLEPGIEARSVAWFAGSYHGTLWIFDLGPSLGISWLFEV